jgi:hypothetical protein
VVDGLAIAQRTAKGSGHNQPVLLNVALARRREHGFGQWIARR